MYLNVILTIFVILQLTMIILAYKFWKKYGKQMFNTYMEMKKSIPQFNEFNHDLKSALSSEWFRGLLPQSKETLKLINSGNYKQAAIEYKNSADYVGKKDKNGNIIQEPLAGVKKRIDMVSNALNAYTPTNPILISPTALPLDDNDVSK